MTSPFAHEAGRRHGAELGMWVFLGSEALLFAGLFALYAGYRLELPGVFAAGVDHTSHPIGAGATLVLLVGSLFAALAGEGPRRGLLLVTSGTALVFLGLKATEYAQHLRDGLVPGLDPFWTLYWVATGLHAVHVAVGGTATAAGALFARRPQHVENVANYWHLVDVIWLFLWPCFYLMGSR